MGKGATPADLAPYIKRGGGGRPPSPSLSPPLAASLLHHTLLRLRRSPAVFFLHLHHHAVVLLELGGDLPHLRCPLERERKELHRHHHGAPSINFNQFLEKEKLKSNGSNFTDWFRHVRIFLTGGSLQYVLDAPLGPPPPPAVSEDVKNVYETRVTRYSEVQCAILCSLEAELQKHFEHHDPCEMMRELKVIFETHAAVESYEASKQFFGCMMEEGSSVSEHVFAMSGHAKKLSDLGIVIPNQLGIHRVLQSLPPSYKNFVMNYNMQNMNKELPELFSMLKSAEVEIRKENQVLMVNKTTSFKKQGKPNKGNFKKGGKKVAAPPEKPKAGPKPETVCYYCQGKGHWKRNCSKYLADLKSGHVKKKGIFDIHVIDVYLTGSRSSELRNKRSLARDEVTMRVGNGSKVDVIAVGTLPLHLPSGLVLNLNNCYLVPTLSMNIISGSCLMQDVKRMKKLHSDGLLESLDFESLDRCEACLMGKMTKTPFSGTMERATDLLEIIHTDVCGPMSVASRGGYRYVLTFTDDLSRYGYIYFMKHKSETFEKFKEFQSEVENQRNKKIKFLRSDRGGEYLSYEFGMHLKKCGILSQLTPPAAGYRMMQEGTRKLMITKLKGWRLLLLLLLLLFWGYALETAAITLNREPSKSVETTPYELWFGKKPKLSFLKVWGCEAYVKKLQPDKLEPKAEKCVFIGYPKETIGYTFYHRSEGKIFVAKNGSFLEKEFLTKEVTRRKVELDEVDEPSLIDQSSAVPEEVPAQPAPIGEEANDDDHEASNEEATEPRRSTRERTTPDWYDPCLNVMIVDNNDEDPATYEEAMMSPDSNKWQEAMKSEMGSMYDNQVWTLVDLPDSRKAVENKWIFKRKTDADGNITVYKARLVAKGFRQIQGVDYDETFSPVAKLKSVRILLAIAAFFDYEIWQMDVKTAFLNGDIEEELYMVQPKGFVDPKNADKVPTSTRTKREGTPMVHGRRKMKKRREEQAAQSRGRSDRATDRRRRARYCLANMYSDEEDTEEYTEHFEEDTSSSTADVEEHVELYTDFGSASIANMTDIEELYTDYGSTSIANMDDIDELYIDTCSTSMDDMVEHHHEDDIDPTIVPNIFGIDTLLQAPQGAIMRVPMHKIIDITDIMWSIKSVPNMIAIDTLLQAPQGTTSNMPSRMRHHLGMARTVIDSHHLMIVVDHHHLMVYIDILPRMIFDDTTQDMVMRQEDESLDMKTFLIRRLLPLAPPPQWPLPRHMPMDSDATSASNKATFHGNVPISYVSAKKLYFDELNAQVSKMPPLEDDLGGDGVEHGEHGILPSPTEAHGVEMVEHGIFPSTKEAHGDEQVEPTPTCLIDELVPIPCEHESHLAHLSESDSELSDFHPICEFECFHLEDMSDTQSETREVDDRSMEDIAFPNTLTSPSLVSSYVALGSTEDEFPLMEKMYMVHEDDDISPCLLQDGRVDHMDPPTSTTPTSHESAFKGADVDKDQERRNPHGAWKKRRRKMKKRREEQAAQSRGRSDRATDRTGRRRARSDRATDRAHPASHRKPTGRNLRGFRFAAGRPDQ
ncbi:hypothetical protein QYE76_031568 [Lolium multiflorum]|uniref:Retrotransposon protein, putative, Ty1-copia subclass n=1 Tax=Lolium multiflorum TaxID=4521 RepID=A0AAD8VKB4_LOLMU|nr:hypothetical protein QYE76_031568 [Lolium multiflorum]